MPGDAVRRWLPTPGRPRPAGAGPGPPTGLFSVPEGNRGGRSGGGPGAAVITARRPRFPGLRLLLPACLVVLVSVGGVSRTGGTAGLRTPAVPETYDDIVLADRPVLYLPLGSSGPRVVPGGGAVTRHGPPGRTCLPNGDAAYVFDGSAAQYVEVPDHDALSVTTTGALTVEAWVRPDTLSFRHTEGTGYVNWLGKNDRAGGARSEWAARVYSSGNTEGRANRVSGYAFNLGGGLGTGSYFQDPLRAGEWIHYVLVITDRRHGDAYPTGYTKIYRDGRLRDQDALTQNGIRPRNTTAPLRIATTTLRSFFRGGIGKVAVYPRELSRERIAEHHTAMTRPGRARPTRP